jgi:hypothetical protein
MRSSPNGNDTKIICKKLTLIENKSLRLISEVSTFLIIYYTYTEPIFKVFKPECFHYSTLEISDDCTLWDSNDESH